jgi:hypothetical protein
MSVSWSAVSGATGYDVQYQTSPSGAWIVVSNVTSPYTVSGLTTGVSYNFQIRHKAGTLISPWSAYATAAAPSACVVSACSPPASNLSLVVGVQAADGSACNNRVGLPQYTPNVALGGLSAWAYDTGGADMTCSKLCASPGPVSKDSRFCVQVLNNGVAFSQQCTGWASEGGGWSAYSPGKDNDQVRVNVENRDMPVGQTLNNVSVGIQLAKGVSGACNIVGAARYTPVGGGDSGWALDGSSGDYDCARVYITGVVSSSNLISENLIKTSGTVQEGQTLNFTASARNNGANATGVGFSDVFEYRYVDNTGAFSNIKTEANVALAAGVTNGDSASYVIPAGRVGQILYIQHCVDSTNAVGESNETVADQCEQINLGTVSAVPVVSASVTAPDCTIVSGGSSCGASVSWTSANVTSPFSVRQGGVQFSTVANSVGIVRTINYGVNTFTFHHNSGVQLATDNAMAACVGGTAWNGTSCTTVPGVVTGLTATPQSCASGDITLTWNAVSGSSGYDIQIDGGAWTNLGNVTTYNHLNQVAGSAHTYNVRAWNAAGAGTAATVSSTIPSDCPGALTVTAGACDTNQISSSWAAVSGATGYDLQYQLSPSGAWTVLTSVTSPRIVSSLNPGSAYNFQVRAKNAGGVSAWSSYGTTNAPAVCAPAVPAVPINLSATPQACGTNRLTLDWSDAANAASYSVYYSSGTFVGNSVGSNYTFTGTANQSYTFYVRSNNSVGVQSANSATFSGTVPGACPVPAASISGSACFIQAGANSCVANTVTWSSSNVTSPISVRQDGVQFATNANQPTAVSRTIPYGTATFTFHHNGGTQVGSQHQISASCIASAPWSTALGMCVAAPINPGLSLSVSPTVVRGNQTATITWSLTTPYSMSCTVFGPKIATVTFDPINAAAPNNIVTGPITAKSEYFFRCTSGSVTWTDSAVVEVVGVIEEI